jgi:hypothetical protein
LAGIIAPARLKVAKTFPPLGRLTAEVDYGEAGGEGSDAGVPGSRSCGIAGQSDAYEQLGVHHGWHHGGFGTNWPECIVPSAAGALEIDEGTRVDD